MNINNNQPSVSAPAAPDQINNMQQKQPEQLVAPMGSMDMFAGSTVLYNMCSLVKDTAVFDGNLDGPTMTEWINDMDADFKYFIDVGVPTSYVIRALKSRLSGKAKDIISE
ncbi:hypothetical protein FBU59_000952 [Linderina macrospora]|uniref:Uncharacterized protein n=1 Tax=Linderina macrospora TaxID=4868 RepID=A0ACC1JFM5_9FUNG|nr:hypothetical protein FBU59_000952 [Linderina macrospora]